LKNKRDHQDGYSPQPTRAVQTLVPDRRFGRVPGKVNKGAKCGQIPGRGVKQRD